MTARHALCDSHTLVYTIEAFVFHLFFFPSVCLPLLLPRPLNPLHVVEAVHVDGTPGSRFCFPVFHLHPSHRYKCYICQCVTHAGASHRSKNFVGFSRRWPDLRRKPACCNRRPSTDASSHRHFSSDSGARSP